MISPIKNILLIDDDSSTNFLNKVLIRKKNIADNVIIFDNGLNIIDYLSDDNSEVPDAILLDLNMPVMDGWEVLDFIENSNLEKLKKCKIVILTASQNPDDEEKSKLYKCVVGYTNKPLDIGVLSEFLS